MTLRTETEALRAQFEHSIKDAATFPVVRDGVGYTDRACGWAWAGYQAGHAAAKAEHFSALGLIADIRAAAGDPKGKLTQDELVKHLAGLRADAIRLDAGRIKMASRDEFGEASSVLHIGVDLRAAIDQAADHFVDAAKMVNADQSPDAGKMVERTESQP